MLEYIDEVGEGFGVYLANVCIDVLPEEVLPEAHEREHLLLRRHAVVEQERVELVVDAVVIRRALVRSRQLALNPWLPLLHHLSDLAERVLFKWHHLNLIFALLGVADEDKLAGVQNKVLMDRVHAPHLLVKVDQ